MPLSLLNDSTRDATEARFASMDRNWRAPQRTMVGAMPDPRPRFIIAAGSRESLAELSAYSACGALKGGPRLYFLDSEDPEKLKAIVDDMQVRAGQPLLNLLPATCIAGSGPNVERLSALYKKLGVEPRFIDAYPLPADDSVLSDEDVAEASKLAAFLNAQREAGRDKVTLLFPKSWARAAAWTRQVLGVNVAVDERLNIRTWRAAEVPKQDRVALVIQRKGEPHPDGTGITSLRAHKYPMAIRTFAGKASLSQYMRFIGQVAHSLEGREPALEFPAMAEGPVFESTAWKQLSGQKKTLLNAIQAGGFSSGELVFFGDTHYSEEGRAMKRSLNAAAQCLFRSRLKMPANVTEGPSALIGRADCFTVLVLSRKQAHFNIAQYEPDRHVAQFLAAHAAMESARRPVHAILVKDLSEDSLAAFEKLFRETAESL